MNSVVLKVNNLSVEFDGEKIIKDVSFEVKEKETFVVLGPNGAGKTVLLRALLGLVPYSGSVNWKKGLKIAYVPQRLPFIKDMPLSVKEFFKLKEKDTVKIKKILNSVGIESSVLEDSIGNISSGQFQRILVAWSLLGEPKVILFDEPTAGIDIGGEETIYKLLDEMKKKLELTIILVTHDLSVIYEKADSVLCLNHTKVCYGVPKEALTVENIYKLFGRVKPFEHNHE